jgi:DnaJ-class molecular chaperone
MVIANRAAPPAPKPDAGKCSNCNGTGKIGDGRIVMTCPECKGTGKTAASICVEGCKP